MRRLAAATALLSLAPPTIAQAPAVASLDKGLTRELARGRVIEQIEARHRLPKAPYAPPAKLIAPYAGAAIGAPMAFQLTQGTEFANAPAAQALAQSVVDRLLSKWQGPPEHVEVRIVAQPFYHAEATPTGLILVGLGTFNADPAIGAATVDELALLLGHELAHILLRHFDDPRGGLAAALNVAGGGLLLYSSAANTTMAGKDVKVAADPRLMRKSLIGTLAVTTLVNDLLTPSFTRAKELEADRLGVDLAQRAQYVVTAGEVAAFVNRHSADQARLSNRMATLSVLMTALNAEVAARAAATTHGRFGPLLDSTINAIGAKAIAAVAKTIAERTREHPDPAERTMFVQNYVTTFYPGSGRAANGALLLRNDRDIKVVAAGAPTVALLDHVRQADDVQRRLTGSLNDPSGVSTDKEVSDLLTKTGFSSKTVSTVKTVRGGGKPPPRGAKPGAGARTAAAQPIAAATFVDDNAAYTARMQALLQQLAGNAAGARATFRRGLAVPLAPVPLAQDYAGLLRDKTSGGEIDSIIGRFGATLGTTDPLLDLAVASAVAREDAAAAEVAAARCASYEAGRLYPRCVAALGYDPMNNATPARTDEGRRAFAGKSLERGFKILGDLF